MEIGKRKHIKYQEYKKFVKYWPNNFYCLITKKQTGRN